MYRYANKDSVPFSILMLCAVTTFTDTEVNNRRLRKRRSMARRVYVVVVVWEEKRCSLFRPRGKMEHPVCLHVEVYRQNTYFFLLAGGRPAAGRQIVNPSLVRYPLLYAIDATRVSRRKNKETVFISRPRMTNPLYTLFQSVNKFSARLNHRIKKPLHTLFQSVENNWCVP